MRGEITCGEKYKIYAPPFYALNAAYMALCVKQEADKPSLWKDERADCRAVILSGGRSPQSKYLNSTIKQLTRPSLRSEILPTLRMTGVNLRVTVNASLV